MPRALEEYSFLKISYPIWMSLVPHLYTLYFTTISLVFVRASRRCRRACLGRVESFIKKITIIVTAAAASTTLCC